MRVTDDKLVEIPLLSEDIREKLVVGTGRNTIYAEEYFDLVNEGELEMKVLFN